MDGLAAGRYVVTVKESHFRTYREQLALGSGEQATVTAKLEIQAATQSVEVHASAVPGATLQPSQAEILKSNQTIRVLGRRQMDAVGPQHIFDNCGLVNGACTTAVSSKLNMPSYETANLSFNVPLVKHVALDLNMLNLFNKKYNTYEYISSGGYYGTSTGGYTFAYPGQPFTVYGSVRFSF